MLKREVGSSAVWSASSAKVGGSVSCVRDGSDKTFWQSDGSLPHTLSVQLLRRLPLVEAQIKIDYKSDESYTPARMSVRIGTNSLDLKEIRVVETKPLSGWLSIPLVDAEGYVPFLCLFFFLWLCCLLSVRCCLFIIYLCSFCLAVCVNHCRLAGARRTATCCSF